MFTIDWNTITVEQFMQEYWQKKPLLIKGGFKQFTDTVDANELAGLAMEEHIESRIVAQPNANDWQVQHGPFEDFSQFGEQGWTLLVQAVNNWSQPTDQLINAFNFIPRWRIDDVMVSFSTPNGGVGPHLDQYDVFIIQGSGTRRWRVGLPDNTLQTLLPHEDLKQVSQFEAIIDEVTEAGDILYIPPNHPHDGIALENAMNFSVGFQAPSQQDLWSAFADKLIDQNMGEQRFGDKDRRVTNDDTLFENNDVESLTAFMLEQCQNKDFMRKFLSQQLTQSHHTLELLIPMQPFVEDQIAEFMQDDEVSFLPVNGVKALIEPNASLLYINGESFSFDAETSELAKQLAQKAVMTSSNLKSSSNCLKNVQLLTSVLNKGYWFVE